ncbi:hypothetical protein BDV96DRAFT_355117 [Lophiotrema nucula]|uniref:Uncharacterized protein n=1 Tax=Lophiotrema nucula TaxID=690887 RepID=A0A6A5YI22_9PLEO|nr:hypothetical protein BDV96DRAFT_355117 [Lophiotrema nucula]
MLRVVQRKHRIQICLRQFLPFVDSTYAPLEHNSLESLSATAVTTNADTIDTHNYKMQLKAIVPLVFVTLSTAFPRASPTTGTPVCSGVPFDTVSSFALDACSKLFSSKPTTSVGATAHIWIGYRGDGINLHYPYRFSLEGDVGAMDVEKCKYAFTSPEALQSNQAQGLTCDDKNLIEGWYFEKEGRKYRIDFGAEEKLSTSEGPPKYADLEEWVKKETFWS